MFDDDFFHQRSPKVRLTTGQKIFGGVCIGLGLAGTGVLFFAIIELVLWVTSK